MERHVAPGGADARGGAEVDGVEAALDAAWGCSMPGCRPTGRSMPPPTTRSGDRWQKAEVGGRTLADILVPWPAVRWSSRMAAVLASIPVGPHLIVDAAKAPEMLIGTDGSFRLGSACGPCPGQPGHPPRRRGPGSAA